MFSRLLIIAIAVQALFVNADPNPTAPGPGDSFKEGSPCSIAWDADTTGTWTQMSIQLMTGNNWAMVLLSDVATVDATKTTNFTYTCPTVTPNSAIYFYQFKSASSNHTYWTTRFAISDTSGATTTPTETTQPNGDKIPWGTGSIVGGSVNGSTSLGTAVSLSSTLSSVTSSGSSTVINPNSLQSSTTTLVASNSQQNPSSSRISFKSSASSPSSVTSSSPTGVSTSSGASGAVNSRRAVAAACAIFAATFTFML